MVKNTRRTSQSALSIAFAILGSCNTGAAGSTWTIDHVYEQSEGVPGAPDKTVFLLPPAFDGTIFAFRAWSLDGYEGIYRIDGQGGIDGQGEIELIVDINTQAPDEGWVPDRFTGEPSLDDGNIVVVGIGAGSYGVFYFDGQDLQLPVSSRTEVPGGIGLFANLFRATLSDNQILYTGRHLTVNGPPVRGLYLHDLTTDSDSLVTNTDDPVPGAPGAEYFTFDAIDMNGEEIVFVARSNSEKGADAAVYTNAAGTLERIVDAHTTVPGIEVEFRFGFFGALIEDGQIAFHALADLPQRHDGIYTWNHGELTTVVDSNTAIPDGSTTIQFIESEFSMQNGNFAFLASTDLDPGPHPDPTGLFAVVNGELSTILRVGDELDGKIVQGLGLHQEGLHGDTVAFRAFFAGGQAAIYTATLGTTGDANGDHLVDMADLNIVLGNFLRSGAPGLPGDLTDDGTVDLDDLNLVLDTFGAGCD